MRLVGPVAQQYDACVRRVSLCLPQRSMQATYLPRLAVEQRIKRVSMHCIRKVLVRHPLLFALPAVALCRTGLQKQAGVGPRKISQLLAFALSLHWGKSSELHKDAAGPLLRGQRIVSVGLHPCNCFTDSMPIPHWSYVDTS